MLVLTKIIKSLIGLLHSNVSSKEIAAGVALGAIIGLSPFKALHVFVIFILIFLLQVNIGAAFFSIFIFSLAAFLVDPLSHQVGYLLLVKTGALTPLWASLYNMPIVPFTRFYNTVVLGSFVISLILFVPIFIATDRGILAYRAKYAKKVESWGIVRWMKSLTIYNIYNRFRQE